MNALQVLAHCAIAQEQIQQFEYKKLFESDPEASEANNPENTPLFEAALVLCSGMPIEYMTDDDLRMACIQGIARRMDDKISNEELSLAFEIIRCYADGADQGHIQKLEMQLRDSLKEKEPAEISLHDAPDCS